MALLNKIGGCLLAGWVVALVWPLGSVAQEKSPAKPTPRSHYLSGRYAEAQEAYQALSTTDPSVVLGLARCLEAIGDTEKAESLLQSAIEREPKSPQIQGQLARMSFARGDYSAAQELVTKVLSGDKDSMIGHWVQAELFRTAGKLPEAQKEYEWFLAFHNRGTKIETSEEMQLVGLAVAELARWTRNHNQFRRLVNEFYPALLAREKEFWPAYLETARLFAEKYNEADAQAAISQGLAINPNAAELHALRAELAIRNFDLATAKTALERSLEMNPKLLRAWMLQADLLMADVRPAEAIDILEKTRKQDPRNEELLGRLAAAYAAVDGLPAGKPAARMQGVMDEVLKFNPHCGVFYLAAGESFDRMRRYPLAAEYFREAQARMPQLISARGQLGMTLMRLGEEVEAAKLLEEAFAIDPFHVRVKNTLEVLDVLQGYAILETDHFVLKFDRGQSELLAKYAARHLEEQVYPQLVEQLGFQPQGKTLIEIFTKAKNTSGHGWFSARMVGLPAIGTVGACAGKMVALTSPDELSKKYNWARVLRHEYVHVLNLQQTDFNIPHWFTEGLAVYSEGPHRPREWNTLLASRAQENQLYNLDTITLGFIRPKNGDDWTLAYCQGALYVDFIREKYGPEAISKMLAAYADHLSTPQVLKACFGVQQADFEADYREFLNHVISKSVGERSEVSKLSFAELQRGAEEPDAAANTLAELAKAYLERKSNAQARQWALAAQKREAGNPLAAYVLARLQLTIGDTEAAVGLLEKSLNEKSPQEDLLALLAALKLKAEEFPSAEKLYLLGEQHFSASDRWGKGLARIYLQQNEHKKLVPVLTRLAELEPDSLSLRKKLAELALEAGDYAAARNWGTEAIHLDLRDASMHALLAAAAQGLKEPATASEEYEVAVQLDPQRDDWRFTYAQTLLELGKKDEALIVAEELKSRSPEFPGLDQLLSNLKP